MRTKIMFATLLAAIGMIAGCGPTINTAHIAELRSAKSYGVMFANFSINGKLISTSPKYPFNEAFQKATVGEFGQKLNGVEIKVLPEDGEFSKVAGKMREISGGNSASRADLAPTIDYGELSDLFRNNKMDKLLVMEVAGSGQKPSLLATGIKFGIASALGVLPAGGSPAALFKLAVINSGGKIVYSDWKIFAGGLLANRGDLSRTASIQDMATTMVDRYKGSLN